MEVDVSGEVGSSHDWQVILKNDGLLFINP
jgi:hypothetical protein